MSRKLLMPVAIALITLAPTIGAAGDHGFNERFHGGGFHERVNFLGWWPFGPVVLLFVLLVGLGYLVASGRMGRWMDDARHWLQRNQRVTSGWWRERSTSSGNIAFDEYRAEAVRRLEAEQREFKEYVERLRHTKDKAEFDEFAAERGQRPQDRTPQPET